MAPGVTWPKTWTIPITCCAIDSPPAEAGSTDNLQIGEGKILRIEGRKTAAYRDDTGKVHLLSPVCTHLKCIVRWNTAGKTWDCPCHGSRFKPTGESLRRSSRNAARNNYRGGIAAGGLKLAGCLFSTGSLQGGGKARLSIPVDT